MRGTCSRYRSFAFVQVFDWRDAVGLSQISEMLGLSVPGDREATFERSAACVTGLQTRAFIRLYFNQIVNDCYQIAHN